MASKSVFCVIALFVLLSSQLAAEGNNGVSNYNMAIASKTLSDKGFHAMSMLLIDMFFNTLNVSQPLTMFCPPDAAFFSSKYPQPPLTLLQYHAVPLKLDNHEDLGFIRHGSKIDTLLLGHPLVVTTLPTDQYESLNEVRVTERNLYNNGV
ncbi:hypothetical protein FNV43_RR06241 [Rhamnella rubrinervis]|uniref:FAS1 domain-containing protein n=1 Tax=Rhamnella rubrinervis TaxID=2594499 RepID=A0A8K0HD31_9ROSA|nr:hypothetical protein FNV43_RR06241 [Rhamnella rubrinervis]